MILYDVGNSAFALLVAALLPIYFHALATAAGIDENLYLSNWLCLGLYRRGDPVCDLTAPECYEQTAYVERGAHPVADAFRQIGDISDKLNKARQG